MGKLNSAITGLVLILAVACQAAPKPTPTPTAMPTPTATPTPIPTPTTTPTPALVACGAPSLVSLIEAPVPVTPTATPTRDPSAPPPTPPPPTTTPRPAPAVDRVSFPEGYQTQFKQFFVFDRIDAKSVQYVCANDIAASVNKGQPFPYGSVLVFETWRPKVDASSDVVLDPNGHMIRATLNTIFVMRKEKGFGEAYGDFRSGEWEYVAYRPDKTYQTPPQNSASCSACHVAAGKDNDWVFRPELFFTPTRYAQTKPILTGANEVGLSRMSFQPGTRTVKAGTTVKWTNSIIDNIDHTVAALDGSFNSGVLKPGAVFSQTFAAPGTYAYVCSLHPDQMRATLRVTP